MSWWEKVCKAAPFVGTIVNGAQAAYHLGAAGLDHFVFDDDENAQDHLTHAMVDGVSAIPYVGTALGVTEMSYDLTEGNKIPEDILWGGDDEGNESFREEIREWIFGETQDFD